MKKSRTTFLYYSPIVSFPIVGNLLINLEILLFKWGLTRRIIFTPFYSKIQNNLKTLISKKSDFVIVKSLKFGRALENFNTKIVIDIKKDTNNQLTINDSYSLMWSLVFASYVTPITKKIYQKIIPDDFPTLRDIVVSYRDPIDLVADYVLQTTRALAKTPTKTHILLIRYPIWIGTLIGKKIFNSPSRFHTYLPVTVDVIQPINLLPTKLEFIPKIKWLNKIVSHFFINLKFKSFDSPILWCFDPDDIDLVKTVKPGGTTVYDCVDMFTTQNPKARDFLKKTEANLIQKVDYFIVISNYLKSAKAKIRNADLVVDQGFDLDSFTKKGNYSKLETLETDQINKIFTNNDFPIAGYVGNLTYRIDFDLILKLIKSFPQVKFVFTDAFLEMPNDDPYSKTKYYLNKIFSYKNVIKIPKTKSKYVVGQIIKRFKLGLIPYDTNLEYNKYCYPLKLYEYFFFGIPVVSTDMSAIRKYKKIAYIGNSFKYWRDAFTKIINDQDNKSHKKLRINIATNHNWDKRVKTILRYIENREYIIKSNN